MAARLRQLLLSAARSDSSAEASELGWITRCLHCRSRIGITADGEPWPGTTLEHVVPRAWFGKPAAATLVARVGAADDARNLALACARCNHQKGRGPDAQGPADAKARAIVERLLETRLLRWRAPGNVST